MDDDEDVFELFFVTFNLTLFSAIPSASFDNNVFHTVQISFRSCVSFNVPLLAERTKARNNSIGVGTGSVPNPNKL